MKDTWALDLGGRVRDRTQGDEHEDQRWNELRKHRLHGEYLRARRWLDLDERRLRTAVRASVSKADRRGVSIGMRARR
ncbi:MAG: hypothetical protein AB7I32_15845 [Gammaproteobacteria bacterium]